VRSILRYPDTAFVRMSGKIFDYSFGRIRLFEQFMNRFDRLDNLVIAVVTGVIIGLRNITRIGVISTTARLVWIWLLSIKVMKATNIF
jgi:hypothetical protein